MSEGERKNKTKIKCRVITKLLNNTAYGPHDMSLFVIHYFITINYQIYQPHFSSRGTDSPI